MRLSAVLLILVLVPHTIPAATIHVPDDQPTIQAGIDAASSGDTVLVAPGEYFEGCYEIDSWWTVSLVVKSGICLLSEGGPGVTSIRSSGCDRILYCVDLSEEVVIDGFTVSDVTCAFQGTGLYCDSSQLVVRDCIFTDCSAFGSPLYIVDSQVHFDECVIHDLGTTENGAVGIVQSTFSATGCEFKNNVSYYKGGAVRVRISTAVFENCLFSNNEVYTSETEGGHGGGIASYHSFLTVSECTFYSNYSAGRGSGIYSESDMYLGVYNTIISHGGRGAALDAEGDPVSWWVYCTDCYGNGGLDWVGFFEPLLGTEGNISQDPMYCDPEAGNYHLHTASPCAAENNPDCGQIGVFGIACGETGVESTTWSDVKILY